jgi:hypothetical protein
MAAHWVKLCTAHLEKLQTAVDRVVLLDAMRVPVALRRAVLLDLCAQPIVLIVKSTQLIHAWPAAATALSVAANDELDVGAWAAAAAVPDISGFARYVRTNRAGHRLHMRTNTTARRSTELNAYCASTLLRALKDRDCGGADRETVVAEYEQAYIDLAAMMTDGRVCGSSRRIWYLGGA